MPKGLRENPPTVSIDITWSPSRKQYVLTVSWMGGTGRHSQVRNYRLVNENRPEIDWEGASLLGAALLREYASWVY